MKAHARSFLGAGLLIISIAVPAMAQGGQHGDNPGNNPGGMHDRRGGPGGDFRGGPPGGRRMAKPELGQLWLGVGRLAEGKTPLTKQQAAKILGLVRPWTKKTVMTEASSKALVQSIKAALTPAQLALVTRGPHFGPPGGRGPGRPGHQRGERPDGPPPGGPEGGPPPGFGGPGDHGPDGHGPDGHGPGRGDGRRNPPTEAERKAMKSFFESYNPFYAPTGYKQWKKFPPPLQDDLNRRYQRHQAILQSVSHIAKH